MLPHLWRRRNQENQVLQRKSNTDFEEIITRKMNNIKQQRNLQKHVKGTATTPNPLLGGVKKRMELWRSKKRRQNRATQMPAQVYNSYPPNNISKLLMSNKYHSYTIFTLLQYPCNILRDHGTCYLRIKHYSELYCPSS